MRRMLGLLGVAAVIAVVSLVSVAGQSPRTPAQTGPALKTSWGEPDLQGIWDTAPVQIPMQRPAKYKDQESFTDEQIAELDKIRARLAGDRTGRRRRLQRGVHLAKADGPAHVADCGSAGWTHASRHPRGDEEEKRDT